MSAIGTEKSPQAFRTITEASEELDVPAHVLRFWEGKFSQLRPLKRAGGRRLYRVDDMALLRGIRALLQDDGYQLKGVQKLLKDQGVAWVRERGGGGLGGSHPSGYDRSNPTDPDIFDAETETIAAMTPPKQTASAFAAASAPLETLAPAIALETVGVLRQALSKLEKARALLDQASGQAAR